MSNIWKCGAENGHRAEQRDTGQVSSDGEGEVKRVSPQGAAHRKKTLGLAGPGALREHLRRKEKS